MAAVNSIISQQDYNNIRNKIVPIIGSGSATNGWGQTLISSAVATNGKVTINEYSNLRYDIINAYTHIFGSAPTTYPVAEGDTIKYNATNQPVDAYSTLADTIVANKWTVGSGQYATSNQGSVTYNSGWNNSLSCTIDIYWANANQARYFFNSGGQIQITSSKSTVTATAQNTSWTSILSTAGTQQFGGNNPVAGATPNDGRNWYRLNNVFQTYYSISGSSPYGVNTYSISARCTDAISNSSGSAAQSQFRVSWVDNYVDPGVVNNPDGSPNNAANYPPGDSVDGTITLNVSLLYATGVLVPASAGNFTVTLPTVAIGAITGS